MKIVTVRGSSKERTPSTGERNRRKWIKDFSGTIKTIFEKRRVIWVSDEVETTKDLTRPD